MQLLQYRENSSSLLQSAYGGGLIEMVCQSSLCCVLLVKPFFFLIQTIEQVLNLQNIDFLKISYFVILKWITSKLGMRDHSCSHSTWDDESRGCCESEASLFVVRRHDRLVVSTRRPCLKILKAKRLTQIPGIYNLENFLANNGT